MNDRYLFKAKGQTDGQWHTGLLAKVGRGVCIICENARFSWICDAETLCQCTGLKDKNGTLIWENDIVNCIEQECCGKIAWNESEAGFYFCALLEDGTYEEEHIYDYVDCMEVIGNIFDNPELLEVE